LEKLQAASLKPSHLKEKIQAGSQVLVLKLKIFLELRLELRAKESLPKTMREKILDKPIGLMISRELIADHFRKLHPLKDA
jgi:hypothetical protein